MFVALVVYALATPVQMNVWVEDTPTACIVTFCSVCSFFSLNVRAATAHTPSRPTTARVCSAANARHNITLLVVGVLLLRASSQGVAKDLEARPPCPPCPPQSA